MARTIARNRTVDRAELLEFVGPRHHAILTTTRRDGRPQLSPVTMGVDDDGPHRHRHLPRAGQGRTTCAGTRPRRVLVLSDDFNGEWVQLDGDAEVIDLPDAVEPLVDYFRAISGEHPDWDEYRQAMVDQGKSLIRITIDRWGPVARGGFPPRLADD